MQVDSLFTSERFEQTASQAEATKRSLPRHMTTDKAQIALDSLTSRIHTFALETIEMLKELPPGVNADSHIQPQVNEITRLIEKHFSDIDKGREPYTVYKDRIHAFNLLEPLYKKLISSPSSHQTTWKEQALLIEQTLLHEDYHEAYIEHLHAIAKLTQSDAFLSIPNLYICHAWPTLENHQEAWIPPFLQRFASDLESAGMVVFINSQDFYSTSHRDKILTVDHVPVIGSPSFVERAQSDVQILGELELIKQRIQKILDGGSSWQSSAIPLLICGTREKAFPPEIALLEHMDLSGNETEQETRSSYLSSLKKLMEHIYAVPQDTDNLARKDWESLWNSFFEKVPNFQLGLTQDVVEKYVKESPLLLEKAQLVQETRQPVTLAQQQAIKAQPISLQTAIIDGLVSYYQSKNTIPNILGKSLAIDQHYTELVIVKDEEQRKKDFEKEKTEGKDEEQQEQIQFEDNRLSSWEDIHRPKEPIELQHLFEKQENEETDPKHILITGRAGIGKSTLCQYIAYQWAHNKLWNSQFDAIFWVPLRKLRDQMEQNPYVALLNSCFPLAQKTQLAPENLAQFIREKAERTLFILDGYDEIAASIRPGSPLYTLTQSLLKQKNWILTSRPYSVHHIFSTHEVNVDRKIENVGFTNEGIATFSRKYFPKDLGNEFLQQIQDNPSVFGSAHVPLNLGLICSVWENRQDKKRSPLEHLTMTSLYSQLVETLMRRSLDKLGIDATEWYSDDFESDPIYSSALHFLEELAWEGLHHENIILSFKNERLKELYLKYCPNPKKRAKWKHFFLNLGFLVSSAQSASLMDNEYYFIHLTFQEFFAAKHIMRLMQNDPKKAEEKITEFKFNARYQVVWWFLAGLIKNDEDLLNRFFWLIDHPKDLVGAARISLLIRCLEESECSELLTNKEALLGDVSDWINVAIAKNHNLFDRLSDLLVPCPKVCQLTVIPYICKAINEGNHKDAHIEMLEKIAQHDPEKTIPILLPLVADENRSVSNPALRGLGKVGHHDPEKVLQILLPFAEDLSRSHFRPAIEAVVNIGYYTPKLAIPILLDAIKNIEKALSADNRISYQSYGLQIAICDVITALGIIGHHQPGTVVPALLTLAISKSFGELFFKFPARQAVKSLVILASYSSEKVIPALLDVVKHTEDNRRSSALNALKTVKVTNPENVILDLLTLKSVDNEVNSVILNICERYPQQTVSALCSAVQGSNEGMAIASTQTLARVAHLDSEKSIATLCSAATSENKSLQVAAIRELGKIDHHVLKEIPKVLTAALDSKDIGTRVYAWEALGKIITHYSGDAIPIVLKAAKGKDWLLKASAVLLLVELDYDNLEEIGSILLETSKEANQYLNRFTEALTEVAHKHPQRMAAILLKAAAEQNRQGRWPLILALRAIPAVELKKTTHFLEQVLSDTDENVQLAASIVLSKCDDSGRGKLLSLFLNAVNHEVDMIRAIVVEELGRIGHDTPEKVIPALLKATEDENKKVRENAYTALAEIGANHGSEVFPALVKAMQDPDIRVEETVIKALGKVGRQNPEQAVLLILEVINQNRFVERTTIVEAFNGIFISSPEKPSLTLLELEKVLPVLLEGMKAPNSGIQFTIIETLEKICARYPKPTVSYLMQAVTNENQNIKAAGIKGLSQTDQKHLKSVLPILLQVLKEADKKNNTRKFTIETLEKICQNHPKIAIPLLLEVTKDKDEIVKTAAIEVLSQTDQKHLKVVIPTLLNLMIGIKRSWNINEVDKTALEALKKIYQKYPKKTFSLLLRTATHAEGSVKISAIRALLENTNSRHLKKTLPLFLQFPSKHDSISRYTIAQSLQQVNLSDAPISPSQLLKLNKTLTKRSILDSTPKGSILDSTPIRDMVAHHSKGKASDDSLSIIALKCLWNGSTIFVQSENSFGVVGKELHHIKISYANLKARQITDFVYALIFPERSAQANYQKAHELEQKGSYDEAVIHYQTAADLVHTGALLKLAKWHQQGEHVPQSFNQARLYLQDAYNLGCPGAKTSLARFENPELLIKNYLTEPEQVRLLYFFRNHPKLSLFHEPTHIQALCSAYEKAEFPGYTECLSEAFEATLREIDAPKSTLKSWKRKTVPIIGKAAWDLLVHTKTPLKVSIDSISEQTKWISTSSRFSFLPMQEYLAARWLNRLLEKNESKAVKLIQKHATNSRFLYVWPLLAGLSQNPVVLNTLLSSNQGVENHPDLLCLEEYRSFEFAKRHLKRIQKKIAQVAKAKNSSTADQEFIETLSICPKIMKAISADKSAFPIKEKLFVPLAATAIVSDSFSIGSLLADLNTRKRQKLACKVIERSGLFGEELVEPILELLVSSPEKANKSAKKALVAMAANAPRKVAPHLEELFKQKSFRQTAIQAWKAMGSQIPERSLEFLELCAKDLKYRPAVIKVLKAIQGERAKDILISLSKSLDAMMNDLLALFKHEEGSVKERDLKKTIDTKYFNLIDLMQIAQFSKVRYKHKKLHVFNPYTGKNESITCSPDLLSIVENNYSFLLSMPLSMYRWAVDMYADWEYFREFPVISLQAINRAPSEPDNFMLKNLRYLEKGLHDWLGDSITIRMSEAKVQLEVKDLHGLEKALKLLGISRGFR